MANCMQNVVIGKRQILREVKLGNVVQIIIARDAEQTYIAGLIKVAQENNVDYVLQGTMADIATKYNIDVPSGSIGVLK